MASTINFALNHMAAPRLNSRELIDVASQLGCVGVELRNDLAEKGLTTRVFFDGDKPGAIGEYARGKGVRLLGLSEAYGFNRWSGEMKDKIKLLIDQAKEAGAESISLIPSNAGTKETDEERLSDLRGALALILPLLDEADLIALVEPLGFTTSSLRRKREAIEAIEAIGGRDRFRLVHDTFHHHIAGETEFFPEWTGIVHISGVVDPTLALDEMEDRHRVLIDEADQLRNVEQLKTLAGMGYEGAYSYEPFAPVVQADANIQTSLGTSMRFIKEAIGKVGA